jgi:hypothetical protein
VDHPVFDHEGPWTEAAYLELPRADRVEVVDGTLLIGPGTSPERAAAVGRVREALEAALPEGLLVRAGVSLRLSEDCILVPDLVITAGPVPDEAPPEDATPASSGEDASPSSGDEEPAAADEPDAVLEAAAALMVIEVVGREHGAVDRSFKPQLYAGCRIPYLLLVDYHGPFAVADMIISGRYHEYARAGGTELLRIEEPFPIELDLQAVAAVVDPVVDPAADSEAGPAPDSGGDSAADAGVGSAVGEERAVR